MASRESNPCNTLTVKEPNSITSPTSLPIDQTLSLASGRGHEDVRPKKSLSEVSTMLTVN